MSVARTPTLGIFLAAVAVAVLVLMAFGGRQSQAMVDVQNASPHPWGDVDCSAEVNPVDSLRILRYDAGLSVAQEVGCPRIGVEVTVVEG